MNKTLFDHETINKAGERAAWVARHGSREDKSGRFLPPPGWKGRLITGAPGELDGLKPAKSLRRAG